MIFNSMLSKSIQNKIKNLFGQFKKLPMGIRSGQRGDEYQQALWRLIINCLVVAFVTTSYDNLSLIASLLMTVYSLFAVAIFAHIRFSPALNKTRILIAMLTDVSVTSLATYITDDIGAIYIGIYLWLIIGYGFRFGRKMLLTTYVASLIGFITACSNSLHWQTHITGFYGLLFTLVTIPLYALSLLSKLKAATNRAEAASKAKSEFLSHISHEIRTPLNGIVGACNLIETTQLNGKNVTLFNVMRTSSSMLLDLVNNVLDLSKIESGKTVVRQEDFYLHNLVLTTLHLFEAQAAQKGIALDYHIDKSIPEALNGDLQHIKQVLINLVGNAVKFTDQGTVTTKVSETHQEAEQINVKFEVSDSGIGIAQASLSKIFESFTQAEESIKYQFGGTGLGTTISKNLVELMGGQIGAESELGVGSTFWFEIPLRKINSESPFAQAASSEVIPFKKPEAIAKRNAYRILVAEDNDTNILILSEMLQLGQHQFDVVKNGEQALDKLQENEYDLMILDCNMPVMGGLEALKIYQAINIGLPQVPAIILSADATEHTRAEFEEVGIAAYLSKPIMIDLLNNAIEDVATQANMKPTNHPATVVQFDATKRASEAHAANKLAQTKNALLDMDRLQELSAISQNVSFLRELIIGFVKDTDANFATLKVLVDTRDFMQINEMGHAIAGSAGNIGANQLSKVCVKLDEITPYDQEELLHLWREAVATYTQTKEALNAYVQEYETVTANASGHL